MTLRASTRHQVSAAVAHVLDLDPEARVIGIHVNSAWEGEDVLEVRGRPFRVVAAPSVLSVREALLGAEGESAEPLIVLSGFPDTEVGADVRARFARGRIFSVDDWETLQSLFKASRIDVSGLDRSVARAVIDTAPSNGYDAVPAGVLDSNAVWTAFFRQVLRMQARDLDLPGLLVWASTEDGVRRFREAAADPALASALRKRIESVLREPGTAVLDFLEGGTGVSPLSLAAACEVVFAEEAREDEAAKTAAVRLERFHRDRPISADTGRRLAQAAADAVRDLEDADQGAIALGHLAAADDHLSRLGVERLLHLSSLTPGGFKRRIVRLGEAILAALDGLDSARIRDCEDRVAKVCEHRLAGREAESILRARMSVRLLRWLGTPEEAPTGFDGHIEQYVHSVSLVDLAREAIEGGDPVSQASAAYGALGRAVAERRRRIDERFAQGLKAWVDTPVTLGCAVPVEEVLSQVAVPLLGKGARILLIVVDGMSWAVAREILGDGLSPRWAQVCAPEGRDGPFAAIAAVPSVTEYSRMSLLSGELRQGLAPDEKRAFASHAGLLSHSDRRNPPELYHKAQVTQSARGPLADDVRAAIIAPARRVIGVVLNAVDERLAGAQQTRDRWTLENIRPLGALLDAAWEGDRIVILTSDHGHVLHKDGDSTSFDDGGDRWRPAAGDPRPGEVLLRGGRVQEPSGHRAVIVPWDEGMRYGGLKNGYHGGATPEEMLAPLLILTQRGRSHDGIEPRELPLPSWWSEAPRAAPPTEAPARPPAAPVTARGRGLAEVADLPIFQGLAEAAEAAEEEPVEQPAINLDWIADLLRSEAFKAQFDLVGRRAASEAEVRKCLEVLDRHGGLMSRSTFAQEAGVVGHRVSGFVYKVQRLVNIDGYDVIRLDRERDVVALNKGLLLKQFEMD